MSTCASTNNQHLAAGSEVTKGTRCQSGSHLNSQSLLKASPKGPLGSARRSSPSGVMKLPTRSPRFPSGDERLRGAVSVCERLEPRLGLTRVWELMTPQLSAHSHVSHHGHRKIVLPQLCQHGERDYITSESRLFL